MQNIRAEVRLASRALAEDIGFFTDRLGMRLERIFPADDPRMAVLSGHGLRLRLERGEGAPGRIAVLADDPVLLAGGARALVSPGGTEVEIAPLDPPLAMPPVRRDFSLRRLADAAPWVIGRAGMHYRDLVPSRLGGAVIASHIRIPRGGPVPDMVHFHKVGFQLIFCIRGWVDVVYEDQGPPLRLTPGDCFIQPPGIRHRVLSASDGLEVIEIGVPAEHMTEIDHAMDLPTPDLRPEREWQGQRFVHSLAAEGRFGPSRLPGFAARDTGIAAATRGVAAVRVLRPDGTPAQATRHDAEILFTFVMAGAARLEGEGRPPARVEAGDAFVIPPGMAARLVPEGEGLELLEVALPGEFATAGA